MPGDVDLTCRVFVGNLAYKTTCDDLKDHFKKIGKVKKAEVYYDHSGKVSPTIVGRPVSKGCGVVEFEDEEDAKEAIRELAESELDGRNILVREDRDPPPANRRSPPPENSGGRPGDWICPKCADLQFASRRECRTCNEPKPETKGKGAGKSQRLGDWTCPECGDHQFARNVKCRQCGEPKPKSGAGTRRDQWGESRSRSRRRSRSRSRSRKGHRRRVRRKVKREGRDKHRSKKEKEKKRKAEKQKRKEKEKEKERRRQKEKQKKRKQETSESGSYDSEYYSSYYSESE